MSTTPFELATTSVETTNLPTIFDRKAMDASGVHNERCVLLLRLDSLRADERGRLVEDPRALQRFETVRTAVERDLASQIEASAIKIAAGSYQCDLSFSDCQQLKLLSDQRLSEDWLGTVTEDCARLAANAKAARPVGGTELGMGDARLALLAALADLNDPRYTLLLFREDDRKEFPIPLPTPAQMRALPKKSKRPQRINGTITAVGLTKDSGCRLEANFGTLAFVPDLTLDSGIELLRDGASVSGTLSHIEGTPTLTTYEFVSPNGSLI